MKAPSNNPTNTHHSLTYFVDRWLGWMTSAQYHPAQHWSQPAITKVKYLNAHLLSNLTETWEIKDTKLLSHPDVILSDVACLRNPPRLHWDFHWFGWQQVPRRLPAEEFLTRETNGEAGDLRLSRLFDKVTRAMLASCLQKCIIPVAHY